MCTRNFTALLTALTASLLCGSVRAQTTTTTPLPTTTVPAPTTTTTSTSTTTTSTLARHAYSAATQACVNEADADFHGCTIKGGQTNCSSDYQNAFANCFGAGNGVKCAKSCISKEATCFAGVPLGRTLCIKACRVTRRHDLHACHSISAGDNLWGGGDASCFTTAASNFDLCTAICNQAASTCHTQFRFCIANCANL
jgi:hypothetical protein